MAIVRAKVRFPPEGLQCSRKVFSCARCFTWKSRDLHVTLHRNSDQHSENVPRGTIPTYEPDPTRRTLRSELGIRIGGPQLQPAACEISAASSSPSQRTTLPDGLSFSRAHFSILSCCPRARAAMKSNRPPLSTGYDSIRPRNTSQ